jgi:hypothetical protein
MALSKRPRPRPGLDGIAVGIADPVTSRAMGAIQDAVNRLNRADTRQVVTADLKVGSNEIAHSLGRIARGCTLTPTVASAAFSWAWVDPGSKQDRVFIDVIGAAQPGAKLEVY